MKSVLRLVLLVCTINSRRVQSSRRASRLWRPVRGLALAGRPLAWPRHERDRGVSKPPIHRRTAARCRPPRPALSAVCGAGHHDPPRRHLDGPSACDAAAASKTRPSCATPPTIANATVDPGTPLDLIAQPRQRPVRPIRHRHRQDLRCHFKCAGGLNRRRSPRGAGPQCRDTLPHERHPPRSHGILSDPERFSDTRPRPPGQCQQDRACPISFAAIPRLRQLAQQASLLRIGPDR